MARPRCSIRMVTPGLGPFNLSTLTGGTQGGDNLIGYTGADYLIEFGGGYKMEGAFQLAPSWIGGVVVPSSGYHDGYTITVNPDDFIDYLGSPTYQNINKTGSFGFDFFAGQTGVGFEFNPFADQYIRTATFLFNVEGAGFRAQADLLDGTPAADVAVAGVGAFEVTWVGTARNARDTGETIRIRLIRTVAAAYAYVNLRGAYLPVPVPVNKARAAKNHIQYVGRFGGQNA